MAYEAPATVVTDEKYTAAAHNIIVEDILQFAAFNRGVFTTEAVRDAAITSPTEGMHAYLTAPTVPAATGATTTPVPLGAQTIYNGAVWVCVTPVGATSNVEGTITSSTSFVTVISTDATDVSVTLVTGATAKIKIVSSSRSDTLGAEVLISFNVAGATTLAASDANAMFGACARANTWATVTNEIIITGLTAGTNTFTISQRVTAGTETFVRRRILVTGIA